MPNPTFEITQIDTQAAQSLDEATRTRILEIVHESAVLWGNYINSSATLTIGVSFENLGQGTLATGGTGFIFGDIVDGFQLLEATSIRELSTGIDNTPGDADIDVTINVDLADEFFTGDASDTADIPFALFDLQSVLVHEIGHGLGILAFRDEPELDVEGTRFEFFQQYDGNQLFFEGPNTVAAAGTPLLLDDPSHVSDEDLIMSPSLVNGLRQFLTPVDIAIIQDLGAPIWAPSSGADILYGFSDNDDSISGGAGNDRLVGLSGHDTLIGGLGADRIIGDTGNDLLNGGEGNDFITAGEQNDTVYGGAGDDAIFAGPGDLGKDLFYGGIGGDIIGGGAGNDTIVGDAELDGTIGSGADTIFGGSGSDLIITGTFDDALGLSEGAIINDQHSNAAWAGSGSDTVFGGDAADQLGGGLNNDRIVAGAGHDTLYGGKDEASDTLFGEAGNDLIFAAGGVDIIFGGDDDDIIFGGAGDDIIDAGDGNDEIYGGRDDDVIDAGNGADILYFGGQHGNDQIQDFNIDEDTLYLRNTVTDFQSAQDVINNSSEGLNSVTIDTGDGNSIILSGITLTELETANFVF